MCCSNRRDIINKERDGYKLKQALLNHINPEQVKGFNFRNNFGLNASEMGRLLHWGSSWSNLNCIVRLELSDPYRNKEAWQFSGCNQNCWDKGNCKKLKRPCNNYKAAHCWWVGIWLNDSHCRMVWHALTATVPRAIEPQQLLLEVQPWSHCFGLPIRKRPGHKERE